MQIFPPYFVDILRYVIINIKISNGGLGMNGSGMSNIKISNGGYGWTDQVSRMNKLWSGKSK